MRSIDAEVRDLDEDLARRVEIAENVYRFELNPLDRARSLAELASLWEADHGVNRGGRPRKNPGQDGQGFQGQTFAARFSAEAQQRTGLSDRAIRRAVALGRGLVPEAIALLHGCALANNESALRAIAGETPTDQVSIARLLASGEARTLAQARVLTGLATPIERNEAEQRYNRLVTLFGRLPKRYQRRFADHVRLVLGNSREGQA